MGLVLYIYIYVCVFSAVTPETRWAAVPTLFTWLALEAFLHRLPVVFCCVR